MRTHLKVVFIIWIGIAVSAAQEDLEMGKPDLFGPEFQKRFIASYGVLEDREPDLQDLEISLLEKIGPMVEENPEFAKSMLEGMLANEAPATATFNFILANLYFNGGAYDDSLAEYNRAIDKFPTFRRAWKNLGLLLVRQADYDEGLKALVRCIELGDTSPDTYGSAAYCHLRAGNLMAAELAYNAAIVLDPKNIEWIEGKAQAMIYGKRYAEAESLLRELIKRDSTKAVYRKFLANVYVELGHHIEAAQVFELIHAMDEDSSDTRLQLANIYSLHGMYDLSVDTYLEASDDQIEEQLGNVLLGTRFLIDQDEVAQASRLFDRVGGIGSDWTTDEKMSYTLLESRFAALDGDPILEESKLQDALKINPLSGEALVRLGSVFAGRGQNAKAMYYFERAYSSENHQYQALVQASQLLIDASRFPEALNLLKRASILKPSDDLKLLMDRVQAAAAGG